MTTWFIGFFPLFAFWVVLCAYTLKVHLSGEYLFSIKFIACLIFNGFFVVTYIDIILNDTFMLLGYRPDIISRYPFIEWVAYFCIPLHIGALPVRREIRGWF